MSKEKKKNNKSESSEAFIKGVDFYIENGFYVFTEHYLQKRGYCCKNNCRHCPYGFKVSSKEL